MRPFVDPRYELVFDRIEMNVIDMLHQVRFVTYGVLPVTTLPQRVFAASIAQSGVTALGHEPREQAFEALPTRRKIGIRGRQRHEDMQVIGKDNNGID